MEKRENPEDAHQHAHDVRPDRRRRYDDQDDQAGGDQPRGDVSGWSWRFTRWLELKGFGRHVGIMRATATLSSLADARTRATGNTSGAVAFIGYRDPGRIVPRMDRTALHRHQSPETGQDHGMSDKPESVVVKMLRWIDSGISRLMERVRQTEHQTAVTQLSLKHVVDMLERIEARLDRIEQRLPPK